MVGARAMIGTSGTTSGVNTFKRSEGKDFKIPLSFKLPGGLLCFASLVILLLL